jgi:hypothetical protein
MGKKVAPSKQGGVLSRGSFIPLLFNLVGDVLNKMIRKAPEKGMSLGFWRALGQGRY